MTSPAEKFANAIVRVVKARWPFLADRAAALGRRDARVTACDPATGQCVVAVLNRTGKPDLTQPPLSMLDCPAPYSFLGPGSLVEIDAAYLDKEHYRIVRVVSAVTPEFLLDTQTGAKLELKNTGAGAISNLTGASIGMDALGIVVCTAAGALTKLQIGAATIDLVNAVAGFSVTADGETVMTNLAGGKFLVTQVGDVVMKAGVGANQLIGFDVAPVPGAPAQAMVFGTGTPNFAVSVCTYISPIPVT